jgi:hypothetical protein
MDLEPSAQTPTPTLALAGVEAYRPELRDELLAFRRALHGPKSPACDPTHLQWLHERSLTHPTLWLYRHEGSVAAQQGAIPVGLRVGTRELEAAWAVSQLIQPEHKLRGIGAVLSQHVVNRYDVALGLEVPDEMRRGLIHQGFIDLGTVPLYVRILRATPTLRGYLAERTAKVVGAATDVSLYAIDRVVSTLCKKSKLEMQEVLRFDSRVDDLWAALALDYPVIAKRDSRTLNWRYADFPDRGRYRSFVFTRGSELIGIAVLRHSRDRDQRVGVIVDFLCRPQWSWAVLAHCTLHLRRAGMSVIHCLHKGQQGERALRQLGFIRRASSWPLLFRARQVGSDALALLSRPQSWFVTFGDGDVDRPRQELQAPPEDPRSPERPASESRAAG